MATTITVSWSEIDTFRQCPLKHQLAYKDRWRKPPVEGTPLSRGSLSHLVLEEHYNAIKRGEPVVITGIAGANTATTNDRINELLNLGNRLPRQTEEQDLIWWIYSGYLEMYGHDPDWGIVAVEYRNEFYLPAPGGGRSRYKIKMVLDLIVRDKRNGKLWVVDHKNTKDLPTGDKMLELDDQFGLYMWGARRQLKLDIVGSIHNCLRTQRNKVKPQPLDERFKRTQLYRTDAELDVIAHEAYATARRAWAQTPYGTAERNPNSDTCRWRCDFTEDCLGGRKGIDMRRSLILHGFTQDRERH